MDTESWKHGSKRIFQILHFATVDGNAIAAVGGSTLTVIPYLDYYGNILVTVTASDGTESDSTDLILTVNPINDTPILEIVDDVGFNEEGTTSITLQASDVDDDYSDLTFSISEGTDITASIIGPTINNNPVNLCSVISLLQEDYGCGYS